MTHALLTPAPLAPQYEIVELERDGQIVGYQIATNVETRTVLQGSDARMVAAAEAIGAPPAQGQATLRAEVQAADNLTFDDAERTLVARLNTELARRGRPALTTRALLRTAPAV